MKKNYETPSIEVYSFEFESMMAASKVPFDPNPGIPASNKLDMNVSKESWEYNWE